jgi:cysteine-rich repeat protein
VNQVCNDCLCEDIPEKCGDGELSKVEGTECNEPIGNNVECFINIDDDFETYDQLIGYHGCVKARDQWFVSPKEFLVVGSICGDNMVQGMEECDDGNRVNNDGCSSECTWEGVRTAWSEAPGIPTEFYIGADDLGWRIDSVYCDGIIGGGGCRPEWEIYMTTNVGCAAADEEGVNKFSDCVFVPVSSPNSGRFDCNVKIPKYSGGVMSYVACVDRGGG